KEEKLIDENGAAITESAFKTKINNGNYHYILLETDSTLTAKLVKRDQYGAITPEKRNEIIKYLTRISGKEISESQIMVVHFYYEDPESPANKRHGTCIDHYTGDRKYLQFFKNNPEAVQFFITAKDYVYDEKKTFEDKERLFQDEFFSHGGYCGNYIIIKPDGSYYKRIGEYRQDEIPGKVKNGF
ncbi:hypothetical protein, partial [uncultured Flavobacterium sp.]|uniref:hypothetical protein n=1 Tax=uncultured Flavobacterium sp. TaxID=165435 RepID=UPI0025FA300E